MSLSKPKKNVKVLILYERQFYSDVLKLADILSSCGEIECFADFYEKQHPSSWDNWTGKKIEECDHVIMVWSQQLKSLLTSENRCDIRMETGMFYSDTVVNCIAAPKFIPVFLNSKLTTEWLPSKLVPSSLFHIKSQDLDTFYKNIDFSDQEKCNHVVSWDLKEFPEVGSLVKYLRGEPKVVQPEKPRHPISIQKGKELLQH